MGQQQQEVVVETTTTETEHAWEAIWKRTDHTIDEAEQKQKKQQQGGGVGGNGNGKGGGGNGKGSSNNSGGSSTASSSEQINERTAAAQAILITILDPQHGKPSQLVIDYLVRVATSKLTLRVLVSKKREDGGSNNEGEVIANLSPILFYNSKRGIYVFGGEAKINNVIEREVTAISGGKAITSAIRDEVRKAIIALGDYTIGRDELDTHENLINLRNGIYNLETGQLLPHSPDIPFLTQLPIAFDPSQECPQIEKLILSRHMERHVT